MASTGMSQPDEGGAKFLRNVRFLQEPHGLTSQKTPFFTVYALSLISEVQFQR
jgi:hypothetical protein